MKFESPSSQERESTLLDKYTKQGVEEALIIVKERFENRKDEVENMDFHNSQHTQRVVERVRRILLTMKDGGAPVTEKDIALGGLSAAFHDVMQEWEENKVQDGDFEKVTRKRFIKDNEEASANAALEFMEKANQEAGKKVFEEQDISAVKETIEVTVPGFDPDRKTVIQPNLNENSSFITRALALADIGAAGMGGYGEFGQEGDALFREENLDILNALKDPNKLTSEQKEYFKGRMLAWSKFQSAFASGRKALLEKELSGLAPLVQDRVKDLFDKFDESIAGADATAVRREKMSFEELAEDMGYRRF